MASFKNIRGEILAKQALAEANSHPKVLPNYQGSFFPLEIRDKIPLEDKGYSGIQSTGIALASDGSYYFIKDQTFDPFLPINEFIAYRLARTFNIPIPRAAILLDRDSNRYCFGSRKEPNIIASTNLLPILRGQIHVDSIDRVLANMYAFDMFVGNDDRKHDNLLVKRLDQVNHRVMIIDHGSCLLANGWPIAQIGFKESSNSEKFYKKVFAVRNLKPSTTQNLLDGLIHLPQAYIENVLSECPSSWLNAADRDMLISWWSSDRVGRIESIYTGLQKWD